MQAGVHTGPAPVHAGRAAGSEAWLSWDQSAAAQKTGGNLATNVRRRRHTAGVLPPGQTYVGKLCGLLGRDVGGGAEA